MKTNQSLSMVIQPSDKAVNDPKNEPNSNNGADANNLAICIVDDEY